MARFTKHHGTQKRYHMLALEPRMLLDGAALASAAEAATSDAALYVAETPDIASLLQQQVPAEQVVVLGGDGLQQLNQILAETGPVSAIHLFTHGTTGGFWLGSQYLSADTLPGYGEQLSTLSQSLAPGADILLYGCDVGNGPAGDQLLHTLSQMTGADVAASTNATGNAALGGDWILEKSVGTIEAATLSLTEFTGRLTVADNIQYSLDLFETYWANGLPSSTDAGLLSLFSASFKHDGMDRGTFLNDMKDDTGNILVGMQLYFQNLYVNGSLAEMDLYINASGHLGYVPGWEMTLENGLWRAYGNQRSVGIDIEATHEFHASWSTNQFSSGLDFDVYVPNGVDIYEVRISGPGISGQVSWYPGSPGSDRWVGTLFGAGDPSWNFAAIYDQPNLQYTLAFYNSQLAYLYSYDYTVPLGPKNPATLSAANFPDVTIGLTTAPQNFTGGLARVNWTSPAGLRGPWVEVNTVDVNNNQWNTEGDLPGGASSVQYTVPQGNYRYVELDVELQDASFRYFETTVEYSSLGLGYNYAVFGLNTPFNNYTNGLSPLNNGYTLLGLGNGGGTRTFNGSFDYYLLYVPPGNETQVDYVVGSNNSPLTSYSQSYNANFPSNLYGLDSSYLTINKYGNNSGGFILLNGSRSLSGITVYTNTGLPAVSMLANRFYILSTTTTAPTKPAPLYLLNPPPPFPKIIPGDKDRPPPLFKPMGPQPLEKQDGDPLADEFGDSISGLFDTYGLLEIPLPPPLPPPGGPPVEGGEGTEVQPQGEGEGQPPGDGAADGPGNGQAGKQGAPHGENGKPGLSQQLVASSSRMGMSENETNLLLEQISKVAKCQQ